VIAEAHKHLPIAQFLAQISQSLSKQNNLVLQAEPGAGKSTALPLSLIESEWLDGRKVIMLEPRRVAAKSIAHYLAGLLGERVGQRIGYQIKNERKISSETILEIVTEGILTRRLQNDPELEDVALIIFDEFHERSLHGDLSLLLSLEVQQTIREDLKLLVMSATIDTQMISNYLGGAAIVECPGRTFPVALSYRAASQQRLSDQVTQALRSVMGQSATGDVLVFLPGQADIKRCIEAVQSILNDPNWLLLPLYGGLSLMQQEQALVPDPAGKRRVVFTTNIAETSLTIEGVTTVIDSGLEKELLYDPASGMTRLETVYISKASAEQRAGRAGRTQAGECIRLWGEDKQRSLREFQTEEIISADLTGLLLELCQWGSSEFSEINWLTPPPRAHYDSAKAMLTSLGMLEEGGLTELGNRAVSIGLPPRLAAMLLQAEGVLEQSIACDLAALLADRDIFQQFSHQRTGVDITERLLAVQDYRIDRKAALKNYPIKRAAMEQLLVSAKTYRRTLKLDKEQAGYTLGDLQSLVGKLLLFAYPDRLAKQRTNTEGRYQLANGRGVFLFDDDPLWGREWLVVADCDAQKKEGRIYNAAEISFDIIEAALKDRIHSEESYSFDKDKQKVRGSRSLKYAALVLKSTVLTDVPKEQFQECLKQVLKQTGLSLLKWTDKCEALISRVQWLGEHMDSFPDISKAILADTVDKWLLPYLTSVNSTAELKRVNIYDLLLGMLSWDEQQLLDKEAPTHYKAPSGKTVPITYDPQQGPIVSVQLQELFGEVDTPMIAGGRVAIRFELLSPARRPIQTTSDLGNFWKTSYFEVAKEMRGKYPKHRWPEEPLLEKAGRSIKRKPKLEL